MGFWTLGPVVGSLVVSERAPEPRGLHKQFNADIAFEGPIVGGVEGDVMGEAVSGSGRGGKLRHGGTASLRARGGYAFGNVLAYGTVGPAWAASDFERNGYDTGKALNGYAVGIGGEVAINRNIAARAELRHYEMGSPTYYTPSGAQKISNGDNFLIVGLGARF